MKPDIEPTRNRQYERCMGMSQIDACKESHAEIKALRNIILDREHQIVKHQSIIGQLQSSESVTIGNLRNINVRLHKTTRSQDDTICDMVNEIDELIQDRDWWRKSALDTEKTRARFGWQNANLRKQTTGLKNRINEDKTKIDTKDKALVVAREIIQILEHKLAASERTNQITEQAIKSAERALVEKDTQIDELQADVTELIRRNISLRDQYMLDQKTIEHLDVKLANEVRNRNTAIDEAFSHTQERIDLRNVVATLEGKLADRERQFNELDAIHERTREILQEMESHAWEQENKIVRMKIDGNSSREIDRQVIAILNQHIIKIEAELSTQKESSKIVDRWGFHVGDKVTSTNRAKQSEGIDISGVVVEIDRGILYVYVTDDGVRLVNKVWMKKV